MKSDLFLPERSGFLPLALFVVCVLLLAQERFAHAQTPELLKDVNASPLAIPTNFSLIKAGSFSYFSGDDGEHGAELWRTDGSADGTIMIADLFPGESGSNPFNFTAVGSTLYFLAQEPGIGRALYLTEGNIIVRVKSIGLSSNQGFQTILGVTGSTLILSGDDGVTGVELYKSDGTENGTELLKDFTPGNNSFSFFRRLGTVNGKVVFSVAIGAIGEEPWATDGNEPVNLKDIRPGSSGSSPTGQGNSAGFLFFSANDGSTGTELYRTDGTPSETVLVQNLESGAGSSSPFGIGSINSAFFFSAQVAGDRELYRSSGTPGDITLVKDIEPGSNSSIPSPLSVQPINNTLLFNATTSAFGRELFRTDGTTNGTQMVKDIAPGSASGIFSASANIISGNLLFGASDGVNGFEVWKSNGTENGTVLVKDIFAGPGSSFPFNGFASQVTEAIFFAQDADLNTALFKTNGTAGGTIKIVDLVRVDGTAGSSAGNFSRAGEIICFKGFAPGFFESVFCGDGTESNTLPILQANELLNLISPETLSNGKFLASVSIDDSIGEELYTLDPISGELNLVKDIRVGSASPDIRKMFNSGGKVFFVADDAPGNFELWVSDGTTAGTIKLTEFGNGTSGSLNQSSELTPFNNGVLFAGSQITTSPADFEPWFSDGTVEGTQRIKDINPGSLGSLVGGALFALVAGDEFFFGASTGAPGADGLTLFRSDGTDAGTLPLTDLPGSGILSSIKPAFFAELNGTIFMGCLFNVSSSNAAELCKTNDSPEGAEVVTELIPGNNGGAEPSHITTFGSKVFFYGQTTDFGREPFITDGTANGTVMLKDISPGGGSSASPGFDNDLRSPLVIDGFLYFLANDGVHGKQLWRTDGTSEGTIALLPPDPADQTAQFFPSEVRLINGQILFRGNSQTVGSEPFILRDECPGISDFKPSVCGCGVTPLDLNANGVFDCLSNPELKKRFEALALLVKKIKQAESTKAKRKAKKLRKNILAALGQIQEFVAQNLGSITVQSGFDLNASLTTLTKKIKKALKLKESIKKDKKSALKALANTTAGLE